MKSHHSGLRDLRPHPHRVRIRKEPIKQALAAEMHDRHDARRRSGDDRHAPAIRLTRRAPRRSRQIKQRRDERAAAGDADPPHVIGDRQAPGDRDVDAPGPDRLSKYRSTRPRASRRVRIDEMPKPPHHHSGARCSQAAARRLARPSDRIVRQVRRPAASARQIDRRRQLCALDLRIGVADRARYSWCVAGCSAPRAAHSRAGSICGCTTSLCGSLRLPKMIACVGQALLAGGLDPPSADGRFVACRPRSWSSRMRWMQ